MLESRVRLIRDGKKITGPWLYWMSRDQRVHDNWALLFAQEMAKSHQVPLAVVFCLVPDFLNAAFRQYSFMIKGLAEVEKTLAEYDIPFFLLTGSPETEIPHLVKDLEVSGLVTDFDPLRIKRGWKTGVTSKIDIPFFEVDAHNIVPCWLASPKQEYAAYTFRPKVHRALPQFLTELPELQKNPHRLGKTKEDIAWPEVMGKISVDRTVPEAEQFKLGEYAARQRLEIFLSQKLDYYDQDRNDPTRDGQSNLSPYLHFGQISAQRVALEVRRAKAPKAAKEAFLEELIVRRELSDNYCFYNENYNNFKGFPEWAQKSLNARRRDKRDYLYSLEDFDKARTHDDLWNAAQREMVLTGKMHGYMRMYWAKKILEWTASPEEAMEIAIYLNDRYELDGRDPNGYVGIAWSIGGVHDRAWKERPVLGKIRYMSYSGLKSKFPIAEYMKKFPEQGK